MGQKPAFLNCLCILSYTVLLWHVAWWETESSHMRVCWNFFFSVDFYLAAGEKKAYMSTTNCQKETARKQERTNKLFVKCQRLLTKRRKIVPRWKWMCDCAGVTPAAGSLNANSHAHRHTQTRTHMFSFSCHSQWQAGEATSARSRFPLHPLQEHSC